MIVQQSRLDKIIGLLDEVSDNMTNDERFEEADTIDDALSLLTVLLTLPDVEVIDDSAPGEKQSGDMETLRQLGIRMRQLQADALAIKAKAAEVRMPLDELRLKKIPELMESLGLKTATFVGLGRLQTAPDIYATTRAGQKPAAMQWLRDCGYEGMIQETYNSSSLKALFRRQIKEGTMPPDDIFNVTPFTRASIVKA